MHRSAAQPPPKTSSQAWHVYLFMYMRILLIIYSETIQRRKKVSTTRSSFNICVISSFQERRWLSFMSAIILPQKFTFYTINVLLDYILL